MMDAKAVVCEVLETNGSALGSPRGTMYVVIDKHAKW